jgi:hypothetical protein
MSGAFQRFVQRHVKSQETRLGDSFEWDGDTYACALGIEDAGSTIDEHGNEVNYTGKLRAREELFESLPAKGDQITVKGSVRKVAHVQTFQGVVWVYLTDRTT